ncbi:biotin--[acetyl-CoA-carboxylase] ligase [candidate division KSB1 bacterium]|nr:biotin--[acetyl-CoA-carboxylase] ligase [candidate division KSB1 bacterium]NIR70403.1 biotin--[acetyl-CoA-carboxylase] ligase [candidate division KSB1 bacterium]NIS25943.1 biotin--[acetyl-CoA-carboxylase] ligase [candidate division KSB1 bacterium]NIT69966.1 biotin--[acetyl-CoA-carboxylase] ligase [candidate division KSB1 bacterium]NIU26631.1 biotin--[acetyl-CoA-carboxylase] ligase [candidate division KSB1 bacterium]
MKSVPSGKPIDAESLRQRLTTQFIGNKIYAFQKIGSTNDYVKRLGRNGMNEGALVLAEHQTKGRGRFQRQWTSPPGKGVCLSILLRPDWSTRKMGIVSLVAAVSVAEAIEAVAGLKVGLKWPNDIQINKKKMCGILIESEIVSEELAFLVLGIGINVYQKASEFGDLKDRATSLSMESGRAIERLRLLVVLLEMLEKNYLRTRQEGSDFIVKEWLRRCSHLNQRIKITHDGREIVGIAKTVDEDGKLVVQTTSNETKIISFGEVQ